MLGNGETRRSILRLLTGGILAVIGLCLAVPALAYTWFPLRRKSTSGSGFTDAGAVADLPIGKWHLLAVEVVRRNGWETTRSRRSVWVRRHAGKDQEVTVLSPICPHLGCPINQAADEVRFVCPCHKGVFDSSGQVVSGPPPRGMDVLEAEVRAGRLWVRWQDFKIGVADRIPVDL
jgi:menaquinol-cytochrome c reductase iron-sulfur subunit